MKHPNFTIKLHFIIAIVVLLNYSCSNKQNAYNSIFQSHLESELSDNNPGILVNITSVDKKMVKKENFNVGVYETLDTSIIYSPMSPPSL